MDLVSSSAVDFFIFRIFVHYFGWCFLHKSLILSSNLEFYTFGRAKKQGRSLIFVV